MAESAWRSSPASMPPDALWSKSANALRTLSGTWSGRAGSPSRYAEPVAVTTCVACRCEGATGLVVMAAPSGKPALPKT